MKKYFLLLYILINCCFFNNPLQAQTKSADYDGVTKTVDELLNFDLTHPQIVHSVREEFEVDFNKKITPGAIPIPSITQPSYKRASQTMHSNFLAIFGGFVSGGEASVVPPDNNGDVGTTQVCATANGRIKFFSKALLTGTATTTSTGTSNTVATSSVNLNGDNFFATVGGAGSSFSDTHVRFDRLSQRWFLVAIDITNATNNYIIIAVSSSATITISSSFTFFKFRTSVINSTTNTFGATTSFFDYPTLGVDKFALYIGGNNFNSAGTAYLGSPMFVINKANLLAGTVNVRGFLPGTGAGQSGSTGSVGCYTPQGVQNDDPNATEGYFIGVSNSSFSQLVFKRVSTPGSSPTLSADIPLNITTYATPNSVKTPGNSNTNPVDGGDERIYAAMMRIDKINNTNTLIVAHSSAVTSTGTQSSSGNRNAVRWYEFSNLTATPTLVQNGNLFNTATTNPISFNYGTIAKSGQGHAIIGFTSTGAAKNLQATYAGRYRTDAANTLQTLVDATATTSNYNAQTGTTQRWGDYTQVVVDPLDDQTMWLFSEYASNTNTWGVRAVQIKAPPPAHPTLATTPVCNTISTITINGTSVNNSEFFDPGADIGGPGFNRLSVHINGPSTIPISNVAFVSPTQITATFNTTTMSVGTYTVVVTNPDGQSDSTTFTNSIPCATALPLFLTSFAGKIISNQANLFWETSNEINVEKFIIEKSNDGQNFVEINSVNAIGNTSIKNEYSSIDNNCSSGHNYYRLKMIDKDGQFTYSSTIDLFSTLSPLGIESVIPNPTSDHITVTLTSDKEINATLLLSNVMGEKVLTEKISLHTGSQEKIIQMIDYPKGIYYFQLFNSFGICVKTISIEKK